MLQFAFAFETFNIFVYASYFLRLTKCERVKGARDCGAIGKSDTKCMSGQKKRPSPSLSRRQRRASAGDIMETLRDTVTSPVQTSSSGSSRPSSRNSGKELGLGIKSPVTRTSRSFSISKTSFSPISKSCPYENLREMGLRMSQEISCRDVRPHILWPTYTSVFRGKEAFIWIKGSQEIEDQYGTAINSEGSLSDDQNSNDNQVDKREWALDILNWMLREKLIFRVFSGVMPKISLGKKTQRTFIARDEKSVHPKDRFIASSKALYRFNDALIADKHVHVVVHCARDLLGKSRDGTSSPFVRLEFGRQRAETKVVTKELNPTWEEHFTFGMVEREERTSLLRISVWDSQVNKSAFLGQVSVFIASNGVVKVPLVKDTDTNGYATKDSCPPSHWSKLLQRSMKSKVTGSLLITTYATDFNFNPHLKIRSSAGKKYFQSDPMLMRQAMRETFGCVLSHEEMGQQGALAAAASSGLWDLVIRLKSLHKVHLEHECEDLKIASALLLPGMQWKNRVIARVRWSKSQCAELESQWILRKNGKWKNDKGVLRMSHLLHEDIRQGQIELEVVMRDNWAAEWDKNARILGTTARFTLEELPRLIGSAESHVIQEFEDDEINGLANDDHNVSGSEVVQDFPIYIRTYAGKSHLVRNGSLRAALYLVPSKTPSGTWNSANNWNDEIKIVHKENEDVKKIKISNKVPSGLTDPILDIVVDTPFPRLKRYLFSNDSSFLLSFYNLLSYRHINLGSWEHGNGVTNTGKTPSKYEKHVPGNIKGMSRSITFLLPEGRAVSQSQTVEVQYVKADQEGVCIVEISNMTADLPLRDLFDAKIEIAIICEGAKYSRIRVSAELLWYKKDWKEKNKVAIKTGFLSGCREKYGSLKQALDWAANVQWTSSMGGSPNQRNSNNYAYASGDGSSWKSYAMKSCGRHSSRILWTSAVVLMISIAWGTLL